MIERTFLPILYGCAGARLLLAAAVIGAILVSAPAFALLARPAGVVGSVVAANGGEEIQYVDAAAWESVEVAQDLVPGDVLRTGPYGLLAILFRDETQVRLHRNSVMRIERIGVRGSSIGSLLHLDLGAIWSRARPVADGLQIETPSATAAIRGTDWALSVAADGSSTLVVLSGRIEFFNDQGRVTVERGEQAFARVGQPPVKRYIVDPRDQPRWALNLDVEWIQMLPVTGERLAGLRAERAASDPAALAASGDAATLLRAAEVAYDLGDLGEAQRLADLALRSAPPAQLARVWLLQGLVALQQRRFDAAETLLANAASGLARNSPAANSPAANRPAANSSGRPAMVTQLGLRALAVETGQPERASQIVAETSAAFPDRPEPQVARAWMTSFAGDHEAGIATATGASERFPDDPAAFFLLAHLNQLTGRTDRIRPNLETALALDPDYFLAWNWLGLYYHVDAPDRAKAQAAYETALAINPHYSASWNNLGLFSVDVGDFASAETSLRRAIAEGPTWVLPRASYAVFLSITDRLREAEAVLDQAYALDPADPSVLEARGFLALQQGRTDDAVDWMLKAIVADPAFPGANTSLAMALYQAGRVNDAQHELATASRLDPDDPVPALIGSVIAQDQAEAGRAITLAQDAFDKYQASSSFAVENLASTRSGLLNLGSAYTNLGLTDWGAYAGELSASPYLANSYFFLSGTYPSFFAHDDAVTQGLLLDPTAVSSPTRYFEFVRQPRIDPTVGGTAGNADGGFVGSASASVQGFSRSGSAIAYNVGASRLEDSGYRKNADVTSTHVYGDFGYRPDAANSFLVRTLFDKADAGVPGPTDQAQKDDESDSLLGRVSLGYQHRFDFDNRIIAQATYRHYEGKYHNNNAFGNGLSAADFSLANSFGLALTRALFAQGLYDASAPGGPPVYVFGDNGPFRGPRMQSTLPAEIADLNTVDSLSQDSDAILLQFRHLFDISPLSLTYGGEWMPEFNNTNVRQNGARDGTGTLTNMEYDDPSQLIVAGFPFVSPRPVGHFESGDRQIGQGYAQASWPVTPDITLEGGGFFRHFDDGAETSQHVDPRIGAAWRITPDHWLRVAYQQDQIMGFASGSLAPVATVGLVVPDPFLAASGGFTSMSTGSRSADLSLRWDAQWSHHLYTFVQAEHQTFDDTVVFLPFSFAGGVALPRGERDALSAGTNVWFLDRFGAFAGVSVEDTEAHVSGPGSDPNMPLLPDYIGHVGLTWVHPWQIQVSLTETFVGERPSDLDPHDDLDSYRTTDLIVSWQPFDKHVLAQVSLLNIFDDDYQVAAGFPAPGRTVLFGLDYRF